VTLMDNLFGAKKALKDNGKINPKKRIPGMNL
jgi:hypothetical protein